MLTQSHSDPYNHRFLANLDSGFLRCVEGVFFYELLVMDQILAVYFS